MHLHLDFTRLDSDASFGAIARFIARNPQWPQRNLLQRRAEEAMTPRLPAETVLAWFAGRQPLSIDGRIRYGVALRASGAKEAGWAVLRDTWINGNFGTHQERAFHRRYRKLMTREDHLARMDRLLWQGHYWQARRMLWKVNARYRLLSQARLMLMRMEGDVDRAIAKVPEELRDHPGLVYERLRWRRRKGKKTALELLAYPPADLVHPEKWWTERTILARRNLQKGHVSEAYRLIKDHGLVEGAAFAEAE